MSIKSINETIFNTIAESSWSCAEKGLRKELVNFKFISMKKSTPISKCYVKISNVSGLEDRESDYLNHNDNFWIKLGEAITPIDYYIEICLQQMFMGETSRFFIKIKKFNEISFCIEMFDIEFNDYLFHLSVEQMYELALKYKENGVAMFKKYPLFAQEYFCRASKCLISFRPFEVLNEDDDGIDPKLIEQLFRTIQINLAACLLKQNRFEEVIHITQFIDDSDDKTKKGIYRRATAFYMLKNYDQAKNTIEKIDYKTNTEFLNLYQRILKDWKKDNEHYNQVMKKMFA